MTFELRIERIVVHGVTPQMDATVLGRTMEQELTRLFTEEGRPDDRRYEACEPVRTAAPVHCEADPSAAMLGARVARAVYGSLRP